jgi:hypothetical protein
MNFYAGKVPAYLAEETSKEIKLYFVEKMRDTVINNRMEPLIKKQDF